MRPAQEPKQDRNREVHALRCPIPRQGSGKCHPEGQRRNGADKFDEALDDVIYTAAEKSRDAANNQPEKKGDEKTNHANGERCARGME